MRDNSLERFKLRPTAKVWLYALRPQLAMLWIEKKQTIPPMEFTVLVKAVCPSALHGAVASTLESKKFRKESDLGFAPEPALAEFVNMEKARGNVAPLVPFDRNAVDLDMVFRKAIQFSSTST